MRRIYYALLCCCFVLGFCSVAWGTPASEGKKIVISKATNQLAFYQADRLVRVFRVATGKDPSFTPEGSFRIINKTVNPPYYRLHIPGGAPNNPLGTRWLGLSPQGTVYGIHGNNKKSSIGTYASEGCIRMYNEDILWLYERIPYGTPVEIVRYPMDFRIFEEAHDIQVKVNGEFLTYPREAGPVVVKEQLFLPLRPLVEPLGYQLQWDSKTETVTLVQGDTQIILHIDDPGYRLNQTAYKANHAPMMYGYATYLPLYFYDQILGAKVDWKQKERVAVIEAVKNETSQLIPPPPLPTSPEEEGPGDRPVEININNEKVFLSNQEIPLWVDGHILIPVNPLLEYLGLAMTWVEEKNEFHIVDAKNRELVVQQGNLEGQLGREVFSFTSLPLLQNSRLYLPVEDLARAFGWQMQYDEIEKRLTIQL